MTGTIGVPEKPRLYQIWTLAGDYKGELGEPAPRKLTAGWIAGDDTRVSTIANIEDDGETGSRHTV